MSPETRLIVASAVVTAIISIVSAFAAAALFAVAMKGTGVFAGSYRQLKVVGANEGQQCDGACPFYGMGQCALVLGTGARNPTGYDFSPFGNKVLETFRILIIDDQAAIRAEAADLTAMENSFFLFSRF